VSTGERRDLLRVRLNVGVRHNRRMLRWDTVIEQKVAELGRYLVGRPGRLDFSEPSQWALLISFFSPLVLSSLPFLSLSPRDAQAFVRQYSFRRVGAIGAHTRKARSCRQGTLQLQPSNFQYLRVIDSNIDSGTIRLIRGIRFSFPTMYRSRGDLLSIMRRTVSATSLGSSPF